MKPQLSPALCPDALLSKSKVYARKALQRKSSKDNEEYQLWASLALELLGKSRLASVHPSLIADPQHFESLFAAAGLSLSTDVKTIQAKTLFERLKRVVPRFDERVSKFCGDIALRRNAELHSGDTPFKAMKLGAWESEYWYAVSVILDDLELTLDDWLGADQANTPKRIASLAVKAKTQAATEKVKAAGSEFNKLNKSERERLLADADKRSFPDYKFLLPAIYDHMWFHTCPACGGKAYVGGFKVDEEIIESNAGEDGTWEFVEQTYVAEQFACPTCTLSLDGAIELEAAKIDLEHQEITEREMAFEPEYGND